MITYIPKRHFQLRHPIALDFVSRAAANNTGFHSRIVALKPFGNTISALQIFIEIKRQEYTLMTSSISINDGNPIVDMLPQMRSPSNCLILISLPKQGHSKLLVTHRHTQKMREWLKSQEQII